MRRRDRRRRRHHRRFNRRVRRAVWARKLAVTDIDGAIERCEAAGDPEGAAALRQCATALCGVPVVSACGVSPELLPHMEAVALAASRRLVEPDVREWWLSELSRTACDPLELAIKILSAPLRKDNRWAWLDGRPVNEAARLLYELRQRLGGGR